MLLAKSFLSRAQLEPETVEGAFCENEVEKSIDGRNIDRHLVYYSPARAEYNQPRERADRGFRYHASSILGDRAVQSAGRSPASH